MKVWKLNIIKIYSLCNFLYKIEFTVQQVLSEGRTKKTQGDLTITKMISENYLLQKYILKKENVAILSNLLFTRKGCI